MVIGSASTAYKEYDIGTSDDQSKKLVLSDTFSARVFDTSIASANDENYQTTTTRQDDENHDHFTFDKRETIQSRVLNLLAKGKEGPALALILDTLQTLKHDQAQNLVHDIFADLQNSGYDNFANLLSHNTDNVFDLTNDEGGNTLTEAAVKAQAANRTAMQRHVEESQYRLNPPQFLGLAA